MTDRVTVVLGGVAAFLAVLAVLATQLPAAPVNHARRVLIIRRIYRTTVFETIGGVGPPISAGPATQTVSGPPVAAVSSAPVPTTRTS